ncbi:alpha/beta hydrolase [Patescibacteria group bacterium]|nr:alpha/beta hydrolase [Patescibacteria group bacterium]MBU1890559.1 alpha/beta hydrolase [Patescibacteria group bacterium]
MSIIKTKSFKLASYYKGDPASPKFALVLPGRLDTKDYPHMLSHVDYLASRGIFALTFDPPGTWESPGDIDLYTMTNYYKAIDELIEYYGNKPTVLIGHSRGGSLAMLAGMHNLAVSHIITAMSNISASKKGEGDIQNGVEISYRDTPPNDSKNKKRFDLSLSYFQDAMKYDILEDLKKCTKPKLLFLGTQDTIVKPDIVKKAYQVAAEPKELHELESEHDYRRHKEIIDEVNETIGKFLDDYKF